MRYGTFSLQLRCLTEICFYPGSAFVRKKFVCKRGAGNSGSFLPSSEGLKPPLSRETPPPRLWGFCYAQKILGLLVKYG